MLGHVVAKSTVQSALPAQRLFHQSGLACQSTPTPNKNTPEALSPSNEAGPSRSKTAADTTTTPPQASQEAKSKPSFTTSASATYAAENKKPLAYLSAPLGVATRPSSRKLSWSERRDLALDFDRRMDKRKAM
jgi:hypothetical protein